MKKKTVLITGGARGIGKAMSKAFAKEGYNVLVNFNKSENEAKELYTILNEKNFSVKLFKANISNREDVEDMVDYCIKEFGGLDVLVNNDYVSQDKLFTDITDEDWDNMMNINLKGSFYCSQVALKYMISEKKGNIINISSGVPSLIRGVSSTRASISSSLYPDNMSVLMTPGAMLFTLIFDGPTSLANAFVIPIMPAFVIE